MGLEIKPVSKQSLEFGKMNHRLENLFLCVFKRSESSFMFPISKVCFET